MNGYTVQAQKFAASYRIPLLEFDKMPFWDDFKEISDSISNNLYSEEEIEERIYRLADNIKMQIAIAVTNSGQILFLYERFNSHSQFSDKYSLYWESPELPWNLKSGNHEYLFQLPNNIMEQWLNNSTNEIGTRKGAIACKETFFSNMVVYYMSDGRPKIQMISNNQNELEEAKRYLEEIN